MAEAKFILSKRRVLEQYNKLKNLKVKISYSYKTNREVGDVLQGLTDCDFSIHNFEEIDRIRDKNRIWFFAQAWNKEEIKKIFLLGIKNLVIDNELDLNLLLDVMEKEKMKVNIILRMKFQEHRIGSGRYFVYGMSAKKINEILEILGDNPFIEKIGIHLHRKSQNTSEWDIVGEIEDSLTEENLKRIDQVNLGGGFPVIYKTHSVEVISYIFEKIKHTINFLRKYDIETIIEPGRFIAGPSIKLETKIIQIYNKIIVLNCSIYNSAIDTVITNIRLLVEGELSDCSKKGKYYLLKGNTPTRDDIFRYKVKLDNPKIRDKIIFLNAGAYNWTSDFCCLKKLETEIIEDF